MGYTTRTRTEGGLTRTIYTGTGSDAGRTRVVYDTPTSTPVAVTRPREGGGTITVTVGGQVTERDARGNVIEGGKYKATQESARQFVSSEAAITRQKLERQKATAMQRDFYKPLREAEIRQYAVSESKPTLIPIKDRYGNIVGIQDSTRQQTYRVESGSVTQRDLDLMEGIIVRNKIIQDQDVKSVISAIKNTDRGEEIPSFSLPSGKLVCTSWIKKEDISSEPTHTLKFNGKFEE